LQPNYLIIGAAKSGTSSLYAYLVQHPFIAPALKKEVHFFSVNFTKGINWYQAHFPTIFRRYYVKRKYGQSLVTGEASPYYIYHPLAPKRIAGIIPQTKLIALLRNPVDRAYSHYHFIRKYGFDTLPFGEAIEREEQRLRGEKERILEDQGYESFSHRHHSYLTRGIYVDQIKVWMDLFSKEQILVLSAEEFFSHPSLIFNRTLAFLGLSSFELKDYRIHQHGNYPEMEPLTRKRLIEYFAPHNEKLYEYLGVRFEWDR
jgi:hypothetical protein